MDTVQGSTDIADVQFPTRVSARGVVSGLLVGLALEATLLVLGAAIGLSALQPTGDVAKGLGIGFAVWLLVTLVISAFFGGWVAAAAGRAVRARDGVLHGVVTWAAVTVVGLALVGGAVRGAVGSIFGIASNQAQQPGVQQQIGNAIDQATDNPQQLAAKTNEAAHGAGLGSWGLFIVLIVPLGAAIGGGAWAAGRERRVAGLPDERALRHRKPIVTAPAHTAEMPTRPIPST
jgi:hypothetical protein